MPISKLESRKGMLQMRGLLAVAVVAAGLMLAAVAQAATASLFGTATVEADHVKIVSDFSDNPGTTTNDFGGVGFTGTGVTDFNSLTTLQAEFNVTDDACKGGSPRFEIDFAGTTNNLFVYLGTFNAGNFDCTANTWIDSGNLITSPDTRFDTSKFAGGTFYDTYAHAKTLLGSMAIDEIRFVVDGGWSFDPGDKEQTVLLRKATINASVFTWTAPPTPPTGLNPAWTCKTFKAQHPDEFKAMFGSASNAFGKCVSHFAKTRSEAVAAAKVACKSVTNTKAKAKCISAKAKVKFNAHVRALTAATVACTNEKEASATAFATKYGTGKTHRNAYANCVRIKLRGH
jgi:hypothetical protein